ncbi:hypothetical protein N8E89_11005 [Phyllobacterium sp. A18/5-2]|uniref:hypothetical protein n=1 Tax=Phyllobacterium sp. A18/5-2 TaxID=2978392 RepID=UPI0021C6C8A7|nr:hypothetical protein [Phyllobacterium sp. A18/5-2]UXN63182.1 hypothetical protein N8E89_11005 [Phyllobacterium sp. A18/5-2]
MSWYRPRHFLATILTMALVAGGILLALPYLVSTDLIRARLIQEISNWTGYTVDLASNASDIVFSCFQRIAGRSDHPQSMAK